MKYQKITKPEDVVLDGISSETVMVGNDVMSVKLTDRKGNVVILSRGQYSDMNVVVPAPPEKIKKFRVKALAAGVPIVADFDEEYDAKNKKQELEVFADDAKIEEVEVEK